jgi:diketogulonate reductase-like aldo/keto reductase
MTQKAPTMSSVSQITSLTLNDGHAIPQLGYGVFQVPPAETRAAVTSALEHGYRHIDTATIYRNEEAVGDALSASDVAREDLFLTTKVWNTDQGRDATLRAFETSLAQLQVDYLDLYLIHWPQGGPTWAWPAMEAAVDAGLTKGIGISNFSSTELQELNKIARIQPAANQIQFSPFEYRAALVEACEAAGIVAQAYSPLGTGRHLDDPVVARIASATDHTPAQVLIRWAIQKGLSVIPKSVHRERIEENFAVFDFELDADSVAALDALDTTDQTPEALAGKWWS